MHAPRGQDPTGRRGGATPARRAGLRPRQGARVTGPAPPPTDAAGPPRSEAFCSHPASVHAQTPPPSAAGPRPPRGTRRFTENLNTGRTGRRVGPGGLTATPWECPRARAWSPCAGPGRGLPRGPRGQWGPGPPAPRGAAGTLRAGTPRARSVIPRREHALRAVAPRSPPSASSRRRLRPPSREHAPSAARSLPPRGQGPPRSQRRPPAPSPPRRSSRPAVRTRRPAARSPPPRGPSPRCRPGPLPGQRAQLPGAAGAAARPETATLT